MVVPRAHDDNHGELYTDKNKEYAWNIMVNHG